MWAFSGSIFFGAIMAVTIAAVTPSATLEQITAAVSANQESIAQLTDAVRNLTNADGGMKNQLLESAKAIINSQNTLQRVLSGSRVTTVTTPGGTPEAEGSGKPDKGEKKVVTLDLNVGDQSFGHNSTLNAILNELKSLNSHFQNHLTTLSCPPPYVMVGSQCFAFNLVDMGWEAARAHCLAMGGDLAEPENLTELRLYIGTRYPRKGRRNFWIGGVNREKVWQWLSGGPMVEGFWYTNEPSGNGECLAMFDGWEFPLTDFPCENERRSVCERILKKKAAR